MAEEEIKFTRLKRQEDIKFCALKQKEELKFMQLKAQEELKMIEFKTEKEKLLREEEKEAKANAETERMIFIKQRELNGRRWQSLIYVRKGPLNSNPLCILMSFERYFRRFGTPPPVPITWSDMM